MLRERLGQTVNSKNKTLLAFCFCFLLGVALASLFYHAPQRVHGPEPYVVQGLYASLFIFIFLAIIFWHRSVIRVCILCLGFLIFGAWRTLIVIPDCDNPANICSFNGESVEIEGQIVREADARIDKTNYVVRVFSASARQATANPSVPPLGKGRRPMPPSYQEGVAPQTGQGGVADAVSGNVLIQTKNYPAYNYGDTLRIECILKKPEPFGDPPFRYDMYLAKEGIFSVCSFPKLITVIPTETAASGGTPPANEGIPRPLRRSFSEARQARNDKVRIAIMKPILSFKHAVANQIDALWPEPHSSFMAGLLYGSRAGLPDDILNNFNRTGITHIIAVSGYNITIIASILLAILIGVGLWRRQAYWVVLVCLAVFTVMCGLSGSVVRAAIMGGLVLTAQYLGRLAHMGTSLVFAAALMLVYNPLFFFWDAGFQLSFLAMIGLVYLAPYFESAVQKISPSKKYSFLAKAIRLAQSDNAAVSGIGQALVATLSAIIMTAPLIMYQFGRLSVAAPAVNMLVVWIIPFLMLAGFAVVGISFVFFPLAQIAAYAVAAGLAYVIMIANFFGSQSWSSVSFRLPWWGMLIMYAALFEIVRREIKKQNAKIKMTM